MMRNGGNYLNRGSGAAARFGQKKSHAENFWPTLIRLFKYMRRDLWGVIFFDGHCGDLSHSICSGP